MYRLAACSAVIPYRRPLLFRPAAAKQAGEELDTRAFDAFARVHGSTVNHGEVDTPGDVEQSFPHARANFSLFRVTHFSAESFYRFTFDRVTIFSLISKVTLISAVIFKRPNQQFRFLFRFILDKKLYPSVLG